MTGLLAIQLLALLFLVALFLVLRPYLKRWARDDREWAKHEEEWREWCRQNDRQDLI